MAKKQTKKQATKQRKNSGLITVALPNSAVSEQFKTLRTNIQFSMVDKKLKSLVVISATPSAGKSTVAVNLAVTFALQGNRVLIVDCDLRRPTVHWNFKLSNGFGLTTLLTDSTGSIDDYMNDSGVEGLSVLTGGPVPPNPAELLSSNRMQQLEKEMADRFDLVIYDTPPLLGFTDAQILAGREDGTIFVIRHGVDTKEEVFKASESLKIVNANVLGVVYNHVPIRSNDHGYYYYGQHNED